MNHVCQFQFAIWEGRSSFTAPIAKFLQGPEPARGRTREECDPQGIQIPSLDLVPWNWLHDQRSIQGKGGKEGWVEGVNRVVKWAETIECCHKSFCVGGSCILRRSTSHARFLILQLPQQLL